VLLAASLARALGSWNGARRADLEVEARAAGEPGVPPAAGGHGVVVPLRVEVEKEPAVALRRIKDELRRAAAGPAAPAPFAEPEVSLRWRGSVDFGEPLRSRPAGAGCRAFEAVARVAGGRLRIDWFQAEGAHRPEAARSLANAAAEALRGWLGSHQETAAASFTPSDFPTAGLTQEDLDDLLAEIALD
jgi:hypothetical protein